MNEKQLKLNADGTMSEESKNYIELHNDIITSARNTYEFAWRMASDLKKMRDEKLYAAGGYKTFGDYTSAMLGMKERQAYNYIAVVEKYSETELQSSAKIGITKLLLLAPLSDADKAALMNDAGEDTVAELKNKISELEKKNGEQTAMFDTELKKFDTELRKSVTKATADNLAEINKLNAQITDAKIEKEKLEKKIADLKAAPAEIKTVADPLQEKKIADLREQVTAAENRAATFEKQLEIAKDSNMTKFSVKFEELQKMIGEIKILLNSMQLANRERCAKALSSILGGIQ